ncbi:MAG: cytidylate kinase-like family protein [Lachnospiraceae bacterium]|nr:cytidylate kinase-like family protein [Lachnospiraceae bacterium]
MKRIITIGRQFGSGGSDIGKELGKALDIKCYDKEILLEAAKNSGMCEEVASQYDEMGQQSFLYSLATSGYFGNTMNYQPINAKLYSAQFQLIRSIAKENDSAIFIGRCADYVLEEEYDLTKIYIAADFDYRVNNIVEKHKITEKEAIKLIQKRDKQRASYYNFYTSKRWSDVTSYDLTLNVAKIGVDGAVAMIKDYLELEKDVK